MLGKASCVWACPCETWSSGSELEVHEHVGGELVEHRENVSLAAVLGVGGGGCDEGESERE